MATQESQVVHNQQYYINTNFWLYKNIAEKWENNHPNDTINLITTYDYNKHNHPRDPYIEINGEYPEHKVLWLGIWMRRTSKDQNLQGWYRNLEDTRSWSHIKNTPALDLLKGFNKVELQLIAKQINLTGYSSSMRKAELLDALVNAI
jgi:hypothetical protein